MIRILCLSAAYAGFVVLLFAGLAKGVSFSSFVLSLSTWTIIPEGMVAWVGLGVVMAELLVSGAWLLGLWRLGTTWLAMFLVAALTAVYAWQIVLGEEPICECFGRLLAFRAERATAPATVLRNVALVGAFACWHVTRGVPATRQSLAAGARHRSAVRGGWTLVELLVVMVVLTVLVGILVPSLVSARRMAKAASSVSRLREHAQIFAMYGLDHRGAFPRFINPDGTHGSWGGSDDRTYPAESRYPYFAQAVFWPVAMQASYYAPHGWGADVFYPPHANLQQPATSADLPYQYSATAIARPEYWRATERTGPLQWRVVQTTEVAFPAQKVILSAVVDRGLPKAEAHVAWMDSSASRHGPLEFEPGYPGGEGVFEGTWSTEASWPIGSHTLSGVSGRDLITARR